MDRPVTGTHRIPARPAASEPPSPLGDPLVELREVTKRFRLANRRLTRKPTHTAVDGVSFTVERGRTLGLVGSTGSGKSTVAHMIMGMVTPSEGTVRVGGHDMTRLDRHELRELQGFRQIVLQDPYSSLDPRMRVGDIVAEPMTGTRLRAPRQERRRLRERVVEVLGLVGLPASATRLYPQQFSGGQRQRIAIARALISEPELIVLDEPTSALDVSVRAQILNLLRSIQERLGLTYLVISHDLVTVMYLASMVAVMHRGRIVEIGPAAALFRTPHHPQTLELLASTPSARGATLLRPELEADATAAFPPTACHYAPRCPLRVHLGRPTRCLEENPLLLEGAGGVLAACHYSDEVVDLAER